MCVRSSVLDVIEHGNIGRLRDVVPLDVVDLIIERSKRNTSSGSSLPVGIVSGLEWPLPS